MCGREESTVLQSMGCGLSTGVTMVKPKPQPLHQENGYNNNAHFKRCCEQHTEGTYEACSIVTGTN